jgi:cytochrome c
MKMSVRMFGLPVLNVTLGAAASALLVLSPASTALAQTKAAKTAAAGPAGDVVKGEKLFAQCKICHSLDAGKNGVGPSLKGIMGKPAAGVVGFTYSPAMKNSGLKWTPDVLASYLQAPMKKVPGTKMAFAGLSKPDDRANVIAYLATKK